MKNIIWQQPNGQVAVYNLPNDANSQAVAVDLLASGSVDAGWTAALFDVQEFPGPPQDTWVIVGGVLTTDETAQAAWLIEEKKRIGRALIDKREREKLMPKMLRVLIMQVSEREAIAAGAARVPALTPAQSLALLRADTTSGYSSIRTFDGEMDLIRVEHGL
jgi:hypothetical protein